MNKLELFGIARRLLEKCGEMESKARQVATADFRGNYVDVTVDVELEKFRVALNRAVDEELDWVRFCAPVAVPSGARNFVHEKASAMAAALASHQFAPLLPGMRLEVSYEDAPHRYQLALRWFAHGGRCGGVTCDLDEMALATGLPIDRVLAQLYRTFADHFWREDRK